MKNKFWALVFIVALSLGANVANAQPVHDPRVADLARAGKVRGAMFMPQFTTDPVTGELQGAAGGIVMVALARALAARVGAELVLVDIRHLLRRRNASKRARATWYWAWESTRVGTLT